MKIGDKITVGNESRIISSITDDTTLTVTEDFTDQSNDTQVEKFPSLFTVFDTENTLKFIINDTGFTGINVIDPQSQLHLQDGDLLIRTNNASSHNKLIFERSKDNTDGSHDAANTSNDTLGEILFKASNGSSFVEKSKINVLGNGNLTLDTEGEIVLDANTGNSNINMTANTVAISSNATVGGDLTVTGSDIILGNGNNGTIGCAAVSGTNTDGKNLTISAGQGTGTGDGGSIIFQVADGHPSTSSGDVNNLAIALTIADDKNATFAGTVNVNSLEIANISILSDSSGTTTLSNIDALDSNTEATIEAAIDTLSNLVTIGKADTTTNFVAGDLTMYNAVDNGNPSISIGSSATERFSITANYEMNAQTLEKVTFATTASSTITDKGSMVFNIDGTDIATIDDGGISLADSKGLDVAGTAILSDSSGTMTLSNIDALDSNTKATIEAAIDTLSNLVTIGKADTTTNFVAGDLTMYNVDNGNPSISIGSSATERFSITANYDMNAQTLEKVTFATTASSTIADKG